MGRSKKDEKKDYMERDNGQIKVGGGGRGTVKHTCG